MPRSTWTPCAGAIHVAPSVLGADHGALTAAVRALEGGGADRIHVDVMDGVFVPNFALGTDAVRAIRRATALPLELHLMIVEPERHLERFRDAGADAITVHHEVCPNLHRTLGRIRELDCRSGAAINPSTPAGHLNDVLEMCDLALVMTISPGFGGQRLIRRTLRKVALLRAEIERQGLVCEVEVDGGVDAGNARDCVEAGADVLVAGTAVFRHSDGPAEGVRAVQSAAGAMPDTPGTGQRDPESRQDHAGNGESGGT